MEMIIGIKLNLLLSQVSFTVNLFVSAEFGVYCCHCRSQARGTQCAVCKRLTFQCAICHVAVRGSSNFCLSCGHGGHTSHMMDWFRRQDECPAGCGCHCLLQSTFWYDADAQKPKPEHFLNPHAPSQRKRFKESGDSNVSPSSALVQSSVY